MWVVFLNFSPDTDSQGCFEYSSFEYEYEYLPYEYEYRSHEYEYEYSGYEYKYEYEYRVLHLC